MSSPSIKTLMGYSIPEVISKLDEALDAGAYSKVEGVPANFTDIKPAWRDEYFNNIFGLCGVGWWYTYDNLVMSTGTTEKGKTTYIATIGKLELYYRMLVNDEIVVFGPIPSAGINENALKPEWAAKGAITSALGSAASRMGWQLSIYQKKRSHTNKDAEGDGAWDSPETKTLAFVDAIMLGVNAELEAAIALREDGVGTLARIEMLRRVPPDAPVSTVATIFGDSVGLFYKDYAALRALAGLTRGGGEEDKEYNELANDLFGHKALTIGELLWMWRVMSHLANGSDRNELVAWYKASK